MQVLLPELLWDGSSLQKGVAVLVIGDRIAGVMPAELSPPGFVPVRLPGKLLMPGFVNAHSHAFQRGLRGLVQYGTGDDSFWTWRERMYGLANTLDPEGVEAIAELAFIEFLRAGYTTVGEFHYLHHQPDGTPYADPDELALRVLGAAARIGIRIVMLRVAYARAGYQRPENPLQRRFMDDSPDKVLAALARLKARGVLAGLAPHSVRAVPESWLREFSSFDGIIHAHVAEQPGELAACRDEYWVEPMEVFARAGLVHERFSAVHLTHPAATDGDLLRSTGAHIVACPSTELDLGDGLLPVESLEGVNIAIGSDSHALIDPFYEIRALELHGRARTGRRLVMHPHDTVEALAGRLLGCGTVSGAKSLGLDTGRVERGMMADLVAVDIDRPELEGVPVLSGLVFSGHPGWVTDVWVGGRRVVEAGRHVWEREVRRTARRVLGG